MHFFTIQEHFQENPCHIPFRVIYQLQAPSHIFHTYQTVPSDSTSWSNWTRLDDDDNNDWPGLPSVSSNFDGRLEVFASGSNSSLYHKWQQSPGHDWHDWTKFDASLVLASDPIVAQNADGRLEVFVRGPNEGGPDETLYHIWQLEAAQGTSWSGWASFGGTWQSDPAVGKNADGRLEVFIRGGNDDAIYDKWQTAPNNGWSEGWVSFGGHWTAHPVVTTTIDGRLQIFAVGFDDHAIYTKQQTAPNNGWSDWTFLGGSTSTAPAVGQNADGRLELVIDQTPDGFLYHKYQLSPNGNWSDWINFGVRD